MDKWITQVLRSWKQIIITQEIKNVEAGEGTK